MTRPAARVWIDSSERTHVVVCDLCKGTWIHLSKPKAQAYAAVHRALELERSRADCEVGQCGKPAVKMGQCQGHYDAARYQARRAG